MSLESLLSEIQARRLVLTYGRTGRVVLWTPCTYVPQPIRRAVALHNRELKRLLGVSDPRVCPNRSLHKHMVIYAVCRECCPECARLRPFVRAC